MDALQAIRIAVARVDMALCGAGNILCAAIPALITVVLLYTVVRRKCR